MPRRPGDAAGQPRQSETEVRKLIVGREITLSGEITSCDKLMVEGSVEANLTNCRDVDIAESGLFKGSASIEEAEIRGRFEGNLVVRKRLLIKASGRVSGTIRYGQIEIECGGQISGDIQAQPSSESSEVIVDVATARAVS
jgi:cytoskeletal protein CcmA (bactofilin family)